MCSQLLSQLLSDVRMNPVLMRRAAFLPQIIQDLWGQMLQIFFHATWDRNCILHSKMWVLKFKNYRTSILECPSNLHTTLVTPWVSSGGAKARHCSFKC